MPFRYVNSTETPVNDTTYRVNDTSFEVPPVDHVFLQGRLVTQAEADLAVFFDPALCGFEEHLRHDQDTLLCIFDDWSVEGGELDGPRCLVRTSDVKNQPIARGDLVQIRSRTFEVAGIQRDGVGTSTLVLLEPGA